MGYCRGGRVVDELAGGLIRLIASFFHAIFQVIFEALLRVLFQIVLEILGRIFSAFIRAITYVGFLILWSADRVYDALFQRLHRVVRRRALAHGLALALLMFSGFVCGAGASTLYHGAHPTQAALLADEP